MHRSTISVLIFALLGTQIFPLVGDGINSLFPHADDGQTKESPASTDPPKSGKNQEPNENTLNPLPPSGQRLELPMELPSVPVNPANDPIFQGLLEAIQDNTQTKMIPPDPLLPPSLDRAIEKPEAAWALAEQLLRTARMLKKFEESQNSATSDLSGTSTGSLVEQLRAKAAELISH